MIAGSPIALPLTSGSTGLKLVGCPLGRAMGPTAMRGSAHRSEAQLCNGRLDKCSEL